MQIKNRILDYMVYHNKDLDNFKKKMNLNNDSFRELIQMENIGNMELSKIVKIANVLNAHIEDLFYVSNNDLKVAHYSIKNANDDSIMNLLQQSNVSFNKVYKKVPMFYATNFPNMMSGTTMDLYEYRKRNGQRVLLGQIIFCDGEENIEESFLINLEDTQEYSVYEVADTIRDYIKNQVDEMYTVIE